MHCRECKKGEHKECARIERKPHLHVFCIGNLDNEMQTTYSAHTRDEMLYLDQVFHSFYRQSFATDETVL